MRRLVPYLVVCSLVTSLLVLPLAVQAAPCEDCLGGLEETDCRPGNPDCGCCLWALPLMSPAPVPELSTLSQPTLQEIRQHLGSVDLDGILHVPRR